MGDGTEHHNEHCTGSREVEAAGDDLVAENLTAMTETVVALHATIDLLVQKTASMAYHIVAMEEILTEMISANGLNLAPVNARIRARIAAGTDSQGDADLAINAAASIASVLPRS